MAKVAGLHLRGSRWCVRTLIPKDLKEAYGTSRTDIALGTSDRKEAALLATLKRAKWGNDFEAKRSTLNATPATAITPDMGDVLANDERVRPYPPKLFGCYRLVAVDVESIHHARTLLIRPLTIES